MKVLDNSNKKSKWGQKLFKCQCECGNIYYAASYYLRAGLVKSCGCLVKIQNKNDKKYYEIPKDIIGKTFGFLKVLKLKKIVIRKGNRKNIIVSCLCLHCNEIIDKDAYAIAKGQSTKCNTKNYFTNEEIFSFLRTLIKKNGGKVPSSSILKTIKNGPSQQVLVSKFGGFIQACRLAGYRGSFVNKKNVNEDFFSQINSEEKAYFLGLMFTDGHIHLTRNVIQIGLQEKDKNILLEFKKRLKSDHNLKFVNIKKKYPSRENVYSFEIGSKKLKDDLIKIGCGIRKTHIIRYPSNKFLSYKLDRHFLRGVIDGDGSMNDSGRIDITSGSKKFLEDIEKKIINHLNDPDNLKIVKRKGSSTTYRLYTNIGKKGIFAKKFFNFLYFNSDHKLRFERKYLKYKSAISKFK